MSANKSPDSTENQTKEGDKLRELFLKEIDETNTWARAGAQLYFGWFTIMLTINGVGASWILERNSGAAPFSSLICFVFIALDILGVVVTYLICRQMLVSNKRVAVVVAGLIPDPKNGDEEDTGSSKIHSGSRPQSPMPLIAIKTAFSFTGLGLFLVLIFWVVLAVKL